MVVNVVTDLAAAVAGILNAYGDPARDRLCERLLLSIFILIQNVEYVLPRGVHGEREHIALRAAQVALHKVGRDHCGKACGNDLLRALLAIAEIRDRSDGCGIIFVACGIAGQRVFGIERAGSHKAAVFILRERFPAYGVILYLPVDGLKAVELLLAVEAGAAVWAPRRFVRASGLSGGDAADAEVR